MLPVTHGVEFTKTCIFLYTILLAIACLLPVLVGMCGPVYLVSSTLLSAGFIYKAWQLKFHETPGLAMNVFRFSIYHLMLLFIALLVDHYLWV
jgi:protoheme IX farnesyltransferase